MCAQVVTSREYWEYGSTSSELITWLFEKIWEGLGAHLSRKIDFDSPSSNTDNFCSRLSSSLHRRFHLQPSQPSAIVTNNFCTVSYTLYTTRTESLRKITPNNFESGASSQSSPPLFIFNNLWIPQLGMDKATLEAKFTPVTLEGFHY